MSNQTAAAIPAEILAIAQQVQQQDNSWHITSHPQYEVRHKERVYGSDFQEEDGVVWIDKRISEPAGQSTANLMEARYRKDYTTETENFRRCPYKEVDQTIQVFFSEAAARRFMQRNAHNYSPMHLYVESGCRNEEWQTIRNWLLSLPA
ncbi:hypothetical protein [Hymenobacter ruber]